MEARGRAAEDDMMTVTLLMLIVVVFVMMVVVLELRICAEERKWLWVSATQVKLFLMFNLTTHLQFTSLNVNG